MKAGPSFEGEQKSFEGEQLQVEGREAPHTHGITSTSSYVFANGDSGPLLFQ